MINPEEIALLINQDVSTLAIGIIGDHVQQRHLTQPSIVLVDQLHWAAKIIAGF
ncbi:unannotated protein [freshwater metagenome]|uniref:Unannotated protein n=1 Tax=freshwater metagenome TaxID=449393 RepID=A0A6J6ICC0_9ZZZZ